MEIRGIKEKIECFKASVLMAAYGLTLEQARALKTTEPVDVEGDTGAELVTIGLAEEVL